MYIDQWLEQQAVEKQASDLNSFLDSLNLRQLEDLAYGRTTLDKVAEQLDQTQRDALKSKSFAIPEQKAKKIGVAGEIKGEAKGKYPIPDEAHARNALARVSQHGTPAEREAVRSKVYDRYPNLKAGFEARHGGENPTSRRNIKKEEQGGISKTAFRVSTLTRAYHGGPKNWAAVAKASSKSPHLFRLRELWSSTQVKDMEKGLAKDIRTGRISDPRDVREWQDYIKKHRRTYRFGRSVIGGAAGATLYGAKKALGGKGQEGKSKTASEHRLAFFDRVARQLAHVDTEVSKTARG